MDRLWAPITLPCDFELRKPHTGKPDQLLLLMHGYSESGSKIYNRLQEVLPKSAVILSPNGPFPVPRRAKDGQLSVGYSWYFYNAAADEYLIDMQPAIAFLTHAVTELGLQHLPTTLIGFSQGGYLAPFLAEKWQQVKQVIGIGAAFTAEEMTGRQDYRLNAIHGENDRIVELAGSRSNHEELLARGYHGEFHSLPGVEHEIESGTRAIVQRLVSESKPL